MVYCSGLENPAPKSPETAEMADSCGVERAPDTLFTARSAPDDGTKVGTEREQRFWSLVDQRSADECWEWRGSKLKKDGRGVFWLNGANQIAPRVAYRLAVGEIPSGLFVCHSCDNPACCNPAHLWTGTAKQNSEDAKAKGRLAGQQITHCPRGHAYDEANTYMVKGTRQCRSCRNLRAMGRVRGMTLDEVIASPPDLELCPKGHRKTGENALMRVKDGYAYAICRICNRGAQRRYQKKRVESGQHLQEKNSG